MPIVKSLWNNIGKPLSNGWDNFLSFLAKKPGDPDRLFSYNTRQQVAIHDWRAGLVYWSIQLSMYFTIWGYVFFVSEGYKNKERSKGCVVTHAAGDAVSVSTGKEGSRYFGIDELTYPGLENGNLFIASKITVHRQMRGFCPDPTRFCESDADCYHTVGELGRGTCDARGRCNLYSWCDVEDDEENKPEIYDTKTDEIEVWVRAFIQFVKLAPNLILTTDTDEVPNVATVFTVRELLQKVEPLPLNYEEVKTLGAVIEVWLNWECDLEEVESCRPEVHARRLDTIFDKDNIGYGFSYSEYIDEDHRLENEVVGVRFLFRTHGLGKKKSIPTAIQTVSNSIPLLSLAVVITDLVLTRVIPNHKKYSARKFEITPDFSHLMEEITAKRASKTKLSDIEKADQKLQEAERHWMNRMLEDVPEEDVSAH